MNDILDMAQDRASRLENFAAELTHAVHLLVLQREHKDSWLDLELDLWRVVGETVKKWERELPHGSESFVCDWVGGHSDVAHGDVEFDHRRDAGPPFSGE